MSQNSSFFATLDTEEKSDICIVKMPFYLSPYKPHLATGILTACLQDTTMKVATIYADMLFAEMIGEQAYSFVTQTYTEDLIGDWLFAPVAFPDHHPDDDFYLQRAARHMLFYQGLDKLDSLFSQLIIKELRRIREKTPSFVTGLAEGLLRKSPKVIACTSTHTQHVAVLALFKCIRELDPTVVTVMGGPNCQEKMGIGTVREFPWVDIVFSGESDEVFAELCSNLLRYGRTIAPEDLPRGAFNREIALRLGDATSIPRSFLSDMDKAPLPDYEAFFKQLSHFKSIHPANMRLPIETSRGCWWYARMGCTFCGECRPFYSKSPHKVMGELDFYHQKYGTRDFYWMDSTVDPAYFKTLFPHMADKRYRLDLQLRPKLQYHHCETLNNAGVTFRFGIEALHDGLLRLMNKGSTALRNVQTLKYALELGQKRSNFDLLVGVPGEQDEWYFELVSWLPLIYHLPPPNETVRPISFYRFSAYFNQPQKYGLNLVPSDVYQYIYPLSEEALADIAYYFDDKNQGQRLFKVKLETPGINAFQECVATWHALWEKTPRPLLLMEDDTTVIDILDTRPCAPERRTRLQGPMAEIYRLCRSVTRRSEITKHFRIAGKTLPESTIQMIIDELKERRLVLEIDARLLSLAQCKSFPQDQEIVAAQISQEKKNQVVIPPVLKRLLSDMLVDTEQKL